MAACLIAISLLLSLAIVSYLFLRVAGWSQRGDTGIAILTSEKDQILKETTILWVQTDKKEITLLSIPGDMPVHAKGTGSTYSLKALYGLHALNRETPANFQKSLVRNIKIDVPFFIVREGSSPPGETDLRELTLGLLFEMRSPSLFPLADRFALLWSIWFGGMKITKLPFPQSVIDSPEGLDDVSYDNFLKKHFFNVSLKKEGYSIAVVNASAQTRLASTVGRLLTAFGLNVLSVSDTPNTIESGSILLREHQLLNSKTVEVIKRYISGSILVNEKLSDEYRADIVLMLGKREATDFAP